MSATRALRWGTGVEWPLLVAGAVFSIGLGLAVGTPDPGLLTLFAAVIGMGVVGFVLVRPFVGFLAMAFSVFFLMVLSVPGTQRAVNVLDLVFLPTLAGSLLLGPGSASSGRAGLRVPRPLTPFARAERGFSRAVLLYFGWAALSVVLMTGHWGVTVAVDSGLSLARVLQGAMIYVLGVIWVRDERRIGRTLAAISVAVGLFAIVNCVEVFAFRVPRAGMVWWVTDVREAIGGPNEAGGALVIVWALVQTRWAVKRERWLIVPMALVLVMLPLTQSRSGLLALATYLLLTVRRVRWRWVLSVLGGLAVVLPLLPAQLWTRLGNSLVMKTGSFELFSFLIRIYGYRVGWRVFLDHPWLGVGYQTLPLATPAYNPYHLSLLVENFFLNALSGMGIVGFGLAVAVFVRLIALGPAVRRVTRPGTFGHELARRHVAFTVALLVVNMTGSSLTGLVGVGQVALWCALLVAAGRLGESGPAEAWTGGRA